MHYFEIDVLPGVKHFRCVRMLASLSISACTSNGRLANAKQNPTRERCMGCRVGALHAGELENNDLKSIRYGGRGEIRTHGGLAPTPVFKTGALNRSATHPSGRAAF
jgi:hypothetical protein